MGISIMKTRMFYDLYYNMTVVILTGNEIDFAIAVGLISLHMPGDKYSRV